MTSVNKPLKIALICAIVAIVAGTAGWVSMLTTGLLNTTGLSNPFSWGLLIAVFAFLVGIGAGSQFVASYIVLAKRDDLKDYVVVAQAIALAGACGAGVAVLIDLGHPLHILAMLLGPNPTSPLTWDMVALTLFIVVGLVCLVMVIRNSKALRIWMGIGLASAFALQLVEGLLFALQSSRIWWHSFIMPVDFIVVAAVCGLAVACIVCSAKESFSAAAVRHLSTLLVWAIGIHIVLALIDLLIVVFTGSAASSAALGALGSVWWLYAGEIGLPLIALVMILAGRDRINFRKLVLWAGILVIVGIFFHRLMLLYPAFGAPTLFVPLSNMPSPSWAIPVSTGTYLKTGTAFEVSVGYVPSALEWLSTLLPIGVSAFVTSLLLIVARR